MLQIEMEEIQAKILARLKTELETMVAAATAPLTGQQSAATPRTNTNDPGEGTSKQSDQGSTTESDHPYFIPEAVQYEEVEDSEAVEEEEMDAVDEATDQGLAAFSDMLRGPQPEVADDPEAALLALMEDSNIGTGPELEEAVAKACDKLIKLGLSTPKLNELLNKYTTPKNCEIMCPVSVNEHIWNSLEPDTRSADLKWQRPQKLLAKAMLSLSRAMTDVKAAALDKPSLNGTFNTMAECFGLLAANNREINLKRLELMKGDFNPVYKSLFGHSTPITSMLFGDAVEEEIKSKYFVMYTYLQITVFR